MDKKGDTMTPYVIGLLLGILLLIVIIAITNPTFGAFLKTTFGIQTDNEAKCDQIMTADIFPCTVGATKCGCNGAAVYSCVASGSTTQWQQASTCGDDETCKRSGSGYACA